MNQGPSPQDLPGIPGVKHIVAVASGKGGVGKSTLAANLAVALGATGASVGLMDADIYGPNIPIMLGIKERPDADGERIRPLASHGIKLISMGFLTGDGVPVIWRGPLITKMVQQFLFSVDWGDLDYLVLDLPPGTGDVQITLRQSLRITGALIVTTPQDLALEDVRRGVRMFQQVQIPILGVVENMSGFVCPKCGTRSDIFGADGGERMCEKFEVPFLGRVPLDPAIRIGGDRGVPIVVGQPDSPQARCLREIAEKVARRIEAIDADHREMQRLNDGLKIIG